MGLFNNPKSPMDGMSEEAKKLAEKMNGGGASGTATLTPPKLPANAPAAPKSGVVASTMVPPPRNVGMTNPPPQTERQLYFQQLKVRIHQQLVERLDVQNLRSLPPDTVRSEVRILIRELCQNEKGLINSTEQDKLMDEVMDETFGLGPLESLLKDSGISDILVNRFDRIYVERKGRLELSDIRFRDNGHLRQIIDRIVGLVGRRIDETSPMVDARLGDGSRVNAIIPPLAPGWPGDVDSPIRVASAATGRSHPSRRVSTGCHGFPLRRRAGAMQCVDQRRNRLRQNDITQLSFSLHPQRRARHHHRRRRRIAAPAAARRASGNAPMNIEGKGEVNQRDLVKNCLRMRPDRIVIGECRGAEAMDMLQAMNTGHEGSMTTIHANNTRDAIGRLEVMIAMAGYDIPMRALRTQVSSAIQIIVQASRLPGGKRKVTRVSEISGMEGEQITMHDIFSFEHQGIDGNGHATGQFICHGIRPRCSERIEQRGIKLPMDLFARRAMEAAA